MHRTLTSSEIAQVGGNEESGTGLDVRAFSNGHGKEKTATSASSNSGVARIYQDRLKIKTLGEFDVIDITCELERFVERSGIKDGYALVYSPHTTCAIILNEKESGLLTDINSTLSRLVPQGDGYLHDDFDLRTENMQEHETKNAHAHLRQLMAGKTSEYIPISKGLLLLGRWQRVMFVEFDCSRDREALIQVCGI